MVPQFPTNAVRCVNHAVEAWMEIVIPLLTADRDPKTVAVSARLAGRSVTAFKERCRKVGVTAKTTVDHARILRACLLSAASGDAAEDLLDIADSRTLRRILQSVAATAGAAAQPGVESLRTRRRRLPSVLMEALVDAAVHLGSLDVREALSKLGGQDDSHSPA
jgi:hypothetical protein